MYYKFGKEIYRIIKLKYKQERRWESIIIVSAYIILYGLSKYLIHAMHLKAGLSIFCGRKMKKKIKLDVCRNLGENEGLGRYYKKCLLLLGRGVKWWMK